MWVNVGVEVVVVRRLCWRAVVLGVSVFVAGPALRCRVRGAAACRVLPSLGARRRAPILGHTGGGVHFPGLFGTRPWRVFGVRLRRFWADLSDVSAGALVQTNTVRNGLVRIDSLLVGAAHTRAVMRIITEHLCDCVRRRGRMCRAWARTSSCAYRRLALLGGFDDLVPLSLGEAPLACHHEGRPSMLFPIYLELTRVHHPAICACPRKSSHNRRDG